MDLKIFSIGRCLSIWHNFELSIVTGHTQTDTEADSIFQFDDVARSYSFGTIYTEYILVRR